MDNKLLKKYLAYATTEEAFAVLFVKKYISQTKGYWVDIVDCRRYEMSTDKLHFRFVVGGMYKRKLKPQYPSKSIYTINGKFDEDTYYSMVRAITWETAHKDIELQKSRNVVPRKFKITGIIKNRSSKDFFREDAPPEIKALANNLYDRTSPLWDKAGQYAKPGFAYEIKKIFIEGYPVQVNRIKALKGTLSRSIESRH